MLISHIVVYADWCGPCKQIAPMYEQLSAQLSRPQKITFAKVNTEEQQEIAGTYSVRAYVNQSSIIIRIDVKAYKICAI